VHRKLVTTLTRRPSSRAQASIHPNDERPLETDGEGGTVDRRHAACCAAHPLLYDVIAAEHPGADPVPGAGQWLAGVPGIRVYGSAPARIAYAGAAAVPTGRAGGNLR
jgi:hypothetical protein